MAANLENLTLTGSALSATGNELNNILFGNSGDNLLDGGLGNDTLNGSDGADTMMGGLGDDIYHVDNVGDVVTELAGEGTDTVSSSFDYTLGANLEKLTLTGSALIATGNELDNILTGNSGNNILDGGLGADTMVGGAGDDIYQVDNTADKTTESTGQGTDTVYSSASFFTLSSNLENIILTGTDAINATGNTSNNSLFGNSGNNILNGGTGADTMAGGLGDDTYYVDNLGDIITELEGQGTDKVSSSITYSLDTTLENLILTGYAAINATGNELDNLLTGNSGSNILDGGAGNDTLTGGTGADTMKGGTGDDIYYVDNVADVVTEFTGEGADTVYSSASFTLAANLENLTLTGSSSLNATGNDLDNLLTGNSGSNILNGGLGNDTMVGGLGNDIYHVDNVADIVTELAGQGTDTVHSSFSFALDANLENITLTGFDSVDAIGNSSNNLLLGNSGDNILNGGLGNDTLTGGTGADAFVFDCALGTSNIDTIKDFISGTDEIWLDDDIFNAFNAEISSTLDSSQFYAASGATTAHDADDRIIFDTNTGRLYYDVDGAGGTATVQVAVLGVGTALTDADFLIMG